jgi:hypothetical protein
MTKVILKTITPKEKAKRQRAKERSRLKQQRRLDTMAEMKAAAAKLRARVTP